MKSITIQAFDKLGRIRDGFQGGVTVEQQGLVSKGPQLGFDRLGFFLAPAEGNFVNFAMMVPSSFLT